MQSKILTDFGKIMAGLRVQVMTFLSPMSTKFLGIAIVSLVITLLSGSLASGVEVTSNSRSATTQLGLGSVAEVGLNPHLGQHIPVSPSQTRTNASLVDVLESNPSLKTFTSALKTAGLIETLRQPGPFTIFAPTDQAFAQLPPDALKEFLAPENREVLVQVLKHHIVSRKILASGLQTVNLTTLQGESLFVQSDEGSVRLNDSSRILQADIQGSNGVIHVVDNILLPESL